MRQLLVHIILPPFKENSIAATSGVVNAVAHEHTR